ncbi:MAG: hypothetical protein R3C14_42790 [Caldilineaceae bacterium]
MVGTLAIGGGAVYGGYRIFKYISEKTSFLKWPIPHKAQREHKNEAQPAPSSTWNVQEARQLDQHGLVTAALSLGATTAGVIFFAPLHYASVPLLVYLGIPPTQEAYATLRYEGRPSPALVETMALAVCLAGGYYLVGSLGFSLYYLGRTVLHRRQAAHLADSWALPQSVRLQRDGEELWAPMHSVQLGDLVIVRHSEMTPVAGVIREGAALLKARHHLQPFVESIKRVGDMVTATEIVQAGQIIIEVQALPLPSPM